jgi:hypothetical protein
VIHRPNRYIIALIRRLEIRYSYRISGPSFLLKPVIFFDEMPHDRAVIRKPYVLACQFVPSSELRVLPPVKLAGITTPIFIALKCLFTALVPCGDGSAMKPSREIVGFLRFMYHHFVK